MRIRTKVVAGLIALAAVTALPSAALAFEFNVTGREESRSGAAKVAAMRGGFAPARGEQLANVWMVMFDGSGRELSRAQGPIDVRKRRWSCAVGDYRAVYYRVEFRVQTPTGFRLVHSTAFKW
jgi:hypothetical protein